MQKEVVVVDGKEFTITQHYGGWVLVKHEPDGQTVHVLNREAAMSLISKMAKAAS